MLLTWKEVVWEIKTELKQFFGDTKYSSKYMAILLLNDNDASKVYVWLKRKFANEIWLNFFVFWWIIDENDFSKFPELEKYWNKKIDQKDDIISLINFLNEDKNCLWIVVQLPLPANLEQYKSEILAAIDYKKDPDWLNWVLMWMSVLDDFDFVPATPYATFKLLEYYNLADFKWKVVTVLWQSNLVGKPLVLELIKRWAQVLSFNNFWDSDFIKQSCQKSDIIISATWVTHLLDENYVRNDNSQIIIDIWWWIKDWKAVWDVNFEKISNKVDSITPVPWWIGPVTVSCLFYNVKKLIEKFS